ncbi:MAG: chromosome segregation protein SMC, partial [Ignavibacteria bacterium]
NNIEKQISQYEFENKKANEEIDKAQSEIQELASESNSIDNEAIDTEKIIEELESERIELAAGVSEIEKEVSLLESEYNEEVNRQNQIKLSVERLNGEIRNLENTNTRAKQAIEQIETNIENRKSEIEQSEEKIVSLENALEEYQFNYDELFVERNKLEEEESEIETELKGIKAKASELESEVRTIRSEREKISDEVHSIDIENNKLSMKLDSLVEHIKEEYNVELVEKEFEDLETYDYNLISDEVHTLKIKLKNLGPINLLAYSEYEEEKERLDFLLQQRNDLIESGRDLVNTIKEINETAENVFLETFNQIRENFIKIFQTLFNEEDEANLILEEGVDPLEAKIEISAKPKGKRPTSIELLSGGEKTLTATALLFAIYLVKPSPFCILDEVDAPLDDANVDRFTNLLREFSTNTQFIIVTHNKRTMEAAENMYGVTIQEEGVSKLVGVQFNEQLNNIVPN